MTDQERVEMLANALIVEMSRAYFTSDGERSAQAIAEMSLDSLKKDIVRLCQDRLKENLAGKGLFGAIGTAYRFTREVQGLADQFGKYLDWALALAEDRIEKATKEDLQRYSLTGIQYSAIVQSVLSDMMLERGL